MTQQYDSARDDVTKRLARVAGHAASLKRMWEEDRPADDMLTQIAAVRSALDQIGRAILELHIDQAVTRAVEAGHPEEATRDLKDALGRFI
ncbi:metal-sensing transcriptional repressor [Tengunoibacter tsumagoiensis]|uniref:Metal-sensitive transcriptional regulator n=1 Tax=Tengunoibacter tsumagoiensis TaxID=2014871 RepID=A0A402A9Y0_9CHLR|nr:metal-sensing transcriptional repressor [Tengunoibacter tsumagoiensis]GCE15987.1 hypothetical protein KTT_58460 [Tengunoibacter tsumagoiensis]